LLCKGISHAARVARWYQLRSEPTLRPRKDGKSASLESTAIRDWVVAASQDPVE